MSITYRSLIEILFFVLKFWTNQIITETLFPMNVLSCLSSTLWDLRLLGKKCSIIRCEISWF